MHTQDNRGRVSFFDQIIRGSKAMIGVDKILILIILMV